MEPIKPVDGFVAHTGTPKGRGVFSARSFRTDEVIERCPVVMFDGSYSDLPQPLKNLVFSWSRLANLERPCQALALGYGSLYNHDNPSNLRYEADVQNRLLAFIADRDIAKGEELTVNYNATGGGASWDKNNWWFERNNIQPITTNS